MPGKKYRNLKAGWTGRLTQDDPQVFDVGLFQRFGDKVHHRIKSQNDVAVDIALEAGQNHNARLSDYIFMVMSQKTHCADR